MKNLFFVLFVLSAAAQGEIILSKSVYDKVPFSSQFIEDGALIRNVSFAPVNALKAQIEQHYNIQLQDRGEAHITVLTPPEAQGRFTDHKGISFLISPIEIHQKYFSVKQDLPFEVLCIGRQTNSTNAHTVFYLVVRSPALLDVRREIQSELEARAKFTGMKTHFDATDYYPHITIGYVGGDVHGVPKGPETCDPDLNLVFRN